MKTKLTLSNARVDRDDAQRSGTLVVLFTTETGGHAFRLNVRDGITGEAFAELLRRAADQVLDETKREEM